MRRHIKSFLVLLAGAVCVVVGIAGLVLPIIPGIPILLLGLGLLLGPEAVQKIRIAVVQYVQSRWPWRRK